MCVGGVWEWQGVWVVDVLEWVRWCGGVVLCGSVVSVCGAGWGWRGAVGSGWGFVRSGVRNCAMFVGGSVGSVGGEVVSLGCSVCVCG